MRVYKNRSKSRQSIIGAVVAILIISNVINLYLFVKEKNKNENLLVMLNEASRGFESVHESLNQKDYQKAFRQLAEFKKQAANLTASTIAAPPKQLAKVEVASVKPPEEKAKTEPKRVAVMISPAPDESPQPLVRAEIDEYLLVCEKDTKLLHLFQESKGKIIPVRQYPCVVGANSHDKRTDGDFATPIGIYFFLRYIPGKALPENYGYGAYVLNYPNFLDRKERKGGGGIWLHGHSVGKNIGADIPDTRGCIVVTNDTLKELNEILKPNGVPVAIVNRLAYVKTEKQKVLSDEIINFMKGWKQAWESLDTKKYMSFYSPDFVNSDGMSYTSFRQHKEKVNKSKKFIRVSVENPSILLPPEQDGNIAIVRFVQRYVSNNFKSDSKKIFYLKKGQSGWQIIGESLY